MEHVLIIDDEPSMLEFLDYVLRKEGYRVSKTSEGKKSFVLLSVCLIALHIVSNA